jgi:hypothetical protein
MAQQTADHAAKHRAGYFVAGIPRSWSSSIAHLVGVSYALDHGPGRNDLSGVDKIGSNSAAACEHHAECGCGDLSHCAFLKFIEEPRVRLRRGRRYHPTQRLACGQPFFIPESLQQKNKRSTVETILYTISRPKELSGSLDTATYCLKARSKEALK